MSNASEKAAVEIAAAVHQLRSVLFLHLYRDQPNLCITMPSEDWHMLHRIAGAVCTHLGPTQLTDASTIEIYGVKFKPDPSAQHEQRRK